MTETYFFATVIKGFCCFHGFHSTDPLWPKANNSVYDPFVFNIIAMQEDIFKGF